VPRPHHFDVALALAKHLNHFETLKIDRPLAMTDYSIVIPIKNEEDNIAPLIQEVEEVFFSLNRPFEIILIDDGSTDRSKEILLELKKSRDFLKLIFFDKNYGQSSAFDAGFKAAQGTFVISLDGDGQNDPKDIPKMLNLAEQCDLVSGWRKSRQDPWSKRIISKIVNPIRSFLCQDGVHDTGCSLKVYRKDKLAKVQLYHGMHRFLPALFIIEGFKVAEIAVSHRPRQKGVSKYHFFNRSLSPLLDMLAVVWMRRRKLRYAIDKELP
jgi:glycosyltransferase involved in cell wall biosynthesis